MADSRMKGRVKGLLVGAQPDHVAIDQAHSSGDPDAQRQALQVLVLAQRTADEHVAATQRQAEDIRADARAKAEQIVREAQSHADGTRREADTALVNARGTAEQIVRDAQAHADRTRREAEKIMADARLKATEIVNQAQASAEDLEREAQQRYDEVVGTLETESSELEQRIDGLSRFERDYRSRLRSFMQDQLRALGDEDPADAPGIKEGSAVAAAGA